MSRKKTGNFDSNNPRTRISSDDPKALEKLRVKLAEAENRQNLMQQANAILQQESTDEQRIAALEAIGYGPDLKKSSGTGRPRTHRVQEIRVGLQ